MRASKIAIFVFLTIAMGFFCLSSIRVTSGNTTSINIDTSQPLSISWPCEIAMVGDEGEKGLRIAPNVGNGWEDDNKEGLEEKVGGEATYKFYVAQDSEYSIWAYAFWNDECSNAIFAQIDDLDKAILGNDPIYNEWHWTRGFDVKLSQGSHTLRLINHSDNIAIQQILFADSKTTHPDNSNLVFSDIFYDGFDGCDYGNFTSWQIISGEWEIKSLDPANPNNNTLIGKSTKKAFIKCPAKDLRNYSVGIKLNTISESLNNGTLGICVGVNEDDYYAIEISPQEKNGIARLLFCLIYNDEKKTLESFETPWENNKWHLVELCIYNNKHIEINIDNSTPIRIPINFQIVGGIALQLTGGITIYCDDIHVTEASGL
jgi:hypothetical protein